MNKCGAKDFQDKRTNILIQLLEEICQNFLDKGIEINPRSIMKKLTETFLEREINSKFLVTKQTIERNIEYRKVWKKYKEIQDEKSSKKKNKSIKKFDNEFQLRDYYDILEQDYIEAIDMNKWLNIQVEELRNEIKKLEKIRGTDYTILANNDSHRYKLVSEIKESLNKGSLVVTRLPNQSVVIKNTSTTNDDRRIEFSEDEWKTL